MSFGYDWEEDPYIRTDEYVKGWKIEEIRDNSYMDENIGSHSHSHPIMRNDMYSQDFICSIGKDGFKVLKNRYNGNHELSTQELVPILSRMIVKNFLKDRMNCFEESLVKEITASIKKTLFK